MNKTILQSGLLTILFIVSGLYSTVNAQFAGGAGNEADPYQVETAEQLDAVRNYLNSHFMLTTDIDLGVSPWSDGEGWEPIGIEGSAFEGTLDGNGHTISNLFINRNTGNVGLFGYIGEAGQISGIRIMNANITSSGERAGILAGYLDGEVSKTEVLGTVSGNARVGGLAGAAELNSTITKVSADITITSTNERAGGLLGSNRGNISHSYAHGSVTGSARVGGLIGNGYSGTVYNNYVAVELTGGGWTGGLVGDRAGGTYTDNFVDEDVASTTSSGGGTFRSTEEMTTFKTYTEVGWDFDTIWGFNHEENNSYPFLKFQDQFTHSLREIADLATLSVTGDINDITTFDANTTNYELKVKNEVTSVDVSFSYHNGSTVDIESPQTIYLTNGNGSFSVEVTAEDQTATKVYTISISPYFQSGAGTEADPYQLATATQLNYVRDFVDKYFEQTADIDLGISPWSDGNGWSPIASQNSGKEFTGTYNGDGHLISNLTINNSDEYYMAFMGTIGDGGVIKNLTFDNAHIKGDGRSSVVVISHYGLIENVTVTGSVTARLSAAGFVGWRIYQGTLKNVVSEVTVDGNSVAGIASENRGTIEQARFTGTLTSSGEAGGIAVRNMGTIKQSYVTGKVSGIGGFFDPNDDHRQVGVGGIASVVEYGSIIDSYFDGELHSSSTTDYPAGGIVGTLVVGGTVENTYASGTVNTESGNSYTGATIGFIMEDMFGGGGGNVESNIWSQATSNQASGIGNGSSSGIFELTKDKMKTKSTFTDVGWDFDTVWQIVEPGSGYISYPYIQNNTQDPVPGYLAVSAPTVITDANITNITSGSVDISGEVTDDGSLEVTERGFTWATVDNPSDTTIVWGGSGIGSFSATVTDLPPGTELTIRAIAVNLADSAYGDPVSFETVKGELLVNGSFTAAGKEYDGDPSAEFDQNSLSLDGIYSGHDVQFGDITLEFDDANAGENKDVTLQSATLTGVDAGKYTVSLTNAPTAAADIAKRPMTITADAQQVVYGEADPALSSSITAGSLVTGDQLTGVLSRASGQDVGIYAIQQGSLTAGDNYDITYQSADFEITQRTLAITTDADQTKIYGETDPSFTFEATNFGWSDDETLLTGTLDRAAGEGVGQYAVGQGDLDAGSNYTIDFTPADFEITQKDLSIVASIDQTKAYGETDPVLTFDASGFEFTDNEQLISGALSRQSGENTGVYSITAGSLTAGDNYAITLDSNPFTITPKVLAVIADAGQEKVYGETDGDISFSASGFEFGDQYEIFSGSLSREKGEDVGEYAIKAGDLDAGENYTIDFQANDFTIKPGTLLVSADGDQHKTFGGDDPVFTFTANNFGWSDGNELITGALDREEGESAGTYELLVGSLDAGLNYEIDFESALFEIEVRSLQITAAEVSKIYGDADPGLNFTASGFVFEDDESILSGELYREAGEDTGTYTILGNELSTSGDYTIEYTASDFIIGPKELKIAADVGQTKIMGEDDPEFTFAAEGFAFDDSTAIFTGALSRETGEETGEYLINAGTIDAGENYAIVFEESIFSVLMTPPIAVQIFPIDGEDKAHVNGPATIEFDQPVLEADFRRVSLKNQIGVSLPIDVSIDENRLIITHEPLEYVAGYQLAIEEGALTNRDGVANRAAGSNFITQVEVPKPVVLQGPYQNEGSVSVQPELAWHPSENATHYKVQLSGNPEFDVLLLDMQNHTELSLNISEELSDYAHYYWRVQASNSSGSSEWSDRGHFVTIAQTPLPGFPAMMSEEISTAPVLQWTQAYSDAPVRMQLSTSENFVEILADTLTADRVVQLTGLDDYRSYYWRVRVESEHTSSLWSDVMQFRTRKASSENDHDQVVENNVNFGQNPEASGENREITSLDYRLIGLPGSDNLRVDGFFEGRYGRDWKVFFDIGTVTEYYDEYHPDDEQFVFAPGRGFWVLSRDVLDIKLQTTSVKTTERDAYTIALQPGWNIISNPHRRVVSWEDVQELNSISGDLFGYEEQFVPADSLYPVSGYYYYNSVQNPLAGIDIPYSRMEQRRGEIHQEKSLLTSAAKSKSPETASVSADFGKNLSFEVELVFSVSDEHQGIYKRPFPSLEMSRYGMMLSDTDMYRGGYLRDETTFEAQGSRYDLELKGKVGSTFNWNAELSGLSSNAGVLLVNPVTKLSWLLESGEEAEATLTEPHTTYELYVGEKNFLLEKQEELMPVEFSLEQNYPNPFNPSTNIRYSVPDQEYVRLEVYDIMGRRVQVLQDGVQLAGWHNVHFNAGSLASGVYFYRLTAGDAMKVGRMTLIK